MVAFTVGGLGLLFGFCPSAAADLLPVLPVVPVVLADECLDV